MFNRPLCQFWDGPNVCRHRGDVFLDAQTTSTMFARILALFVVIAAAAGELRNNQCMCCVLFVYLHLFPRATKNDLQCG